MTLQRDEPEILDGSRSWAKTQELFNGHVDPTRQRHAVRCTWYDTTVDDNEGAFCVVQADSALEELVGEHVRVAYNDKEQFLYCVAGSADIPEPFAITRQAMLALAPLSHDYIEVTVQPLR